MTEQPDHVRERLQDIRNEHYALDRQITPIQERMLTLLNEATATGRLEEWLDMRPQEGVHHES